MGPPEQLTSPSLLVRAQAQAPGAWPQLVALYGPLLRSWCRRGGVPDADAEDVAQEVFLAVARGLSEFQRQRAGSFRRWLRGIARHKALDYHRRRQRQPDGAGGSDALEMLHNLPDPEAGSADDSAEVGDLYRRAVELIRSAFEGPTFLAFWQTAVEGRETAAVAAGLGLSPTAVRIAKSRVLARLRAEAGELIE
jgi:RNA polymerase sigma-70 factor (ECF subfamily)